MSPRFVVFPAPLNNPMRPPLVAKILGTFTIGVSVGISVEIFVAIRLGGCEEIAVGSAVNSVGVSVGIAAKTFVGIKLDGGCEDTAVGSQFDTVAIGGMPVGGIERAGIGDVVVAMVESRGSGDSVGLGCFVVELGLSGATARVWELLSPPAQLPVPQRPPTTAASRTIIKSSQ